MPESEVIITAAGPEQGFCSRVYSSEGKAREGANTIELNLENLSSGLYIVQLVQDGSRQQVNLIVK